MRNKIHPILLFLSTICSLQAQQSNSPALWFKVNPDSVSTEYWKDSSGNGRHALLPEGTKDSIYLINHNPARKFSTTNSFGQIAYNPDGVSELIFMAVYQPLDTAEMGLLSSKNTLKRDLSISSKRALGPDSMIHVYSEGNLLPQLATIKQVWEDAKDKSEDGYLSFLEAKNEAGTLGYNGYLAELILFDKSLTFLETVKWETYLAIKYGISLHSKNYVSSSEIVLWDFEEFEEFGNRITGLGRDDHFNLIQQKSVNVKDTLSILKFILGNSEEIGDDFISDQHFWLFGDDNASLEAIKGSGKDSIMTMLDRKWLNVTNGNEILSTVSSVALDYKQLPNDSLGFWLVIDRSGQADFSVDLLEYIEPDSVTIDSIAIYNNIVWDNDGSGTDNFSFAKIQELFAAIRVVNLPTCTAPQKGLVDVEVIKGEGPYQYEWISLDGQEINTNGSFETRLKIEGLKTGDYLLKLKDKHGISFERYFNLPIENAFPFDLGENQKITEGQTIVLDAAKTVPDSIDATYFWEGSFGFTAHTNEIMVTEPGVYRAYITNKKNGCVFVDEIVIEGSQIQSIELYPNPVKINNTFKISISLNSVQKIYVRIVDVKGNIHYLTEQEGQSEYLVDLSIAESGRYLIYVEAGDSKESRKLVVY